MDVFSSFFESLPPWLGTLPNWITATSCVTFLGLFIRWRWVEGKLKIEAARVTIDAKKVERADEANIRDHYAKEVESLRGKLDRQEKNFQDALERQSTRHNDALNALEERHGRAMLNVEERQARCERERDEMGIRISGLREELAGVRQQVRMNSADQLRLLAASGEPIPPYALEAARTIVERQQRERGA